MTYHIHIINEHDEEHGLWQKVGLKKWTKNGKPWYGNFRYLPIFRPMNCNCMCNTGFGCWQYDNKECFDPGRHETKTPEEYMAWVDRKWKRGK